MIENRDVRFAEDTDDVEYILHPDHVDTFQTMKEICRKINAIGIAEFKLHKMAEIDFFDYLGQTPLPGRIFVPRERDNKGEKEVFKLSSDASKLRADIERFIRIDGKLGPEDVQITTDIELIAAMLNQGKFFEKRILVRVKRGQQEQRSLSPEDNLVPDRSWLQDTNVHVTEKAKEIYRQDKASTQNEENKAGRKKSRKQKSEKQTERKIEFSLSKSSKEFKKQTPKRKYTKEKSAMREDHQDTILSSEEDNGEGVTQINGISSGRFEVLSPRNVAGKVVNGTKKQGRMKGKKGKRAKSKGRRQEQAPGEMTAGCPEGRPDTIDSSLDIVPVQLQKPQQPKQQQQYKQQPQKQQQQKQQQNQKQPKQQPQKQQQKQLQQLKQQQQNPQQEQQQKQQQQQKHQQQKQQQRQQNQQQEQQQKRQQQQKQQQQEQQNQQQQKQQQQKQQQQKQQQLKQQQQNQQQQKQLQQKRQQQQKQQQQEEQNQQQQKQQQQKQQQQKQQQHKQQQQKQQQQKQQQMKQQQQQKQQQQNQQQQKQQQKQQLRPQSQHVERQRLDLSKPDVILVCGLCWKNGQKYSQNEVKPEYCEAPNSCHRWQHERIFVAMPQKKIIRHPPKIKSDFKMCNKAKCPRDNCSFAHSEVELEVWRWLKENKVKLGDLARKCSSTPERMAAPVCPDTSHLPKYPLISPVASYYCEFCDCSCNSKTQLDIHCASRKHQDNIESDKDQCWNFRNPPPVHPREDYKLCPRLPTCYWSGVQQEDNYCPFAHSIDELDEWKKRRKLRSEKKHKAKKLNLHSYMDSLQEEEKASQSNGSVLAEKIDGISIQCDKDLNQLTECKTAVITWLFLVKAEGLELNRAALLYNKCRAYFSLISDEAEENTKCQLLTSDIIKQDSGIYYVQVQFKAGLFGSFTQTVVFDFGRRPVLVQKLQVDVGDKILLETISDCRRRFTYLRWTEENSTIIRFPPDKSVENDEQELLNRYKAPRSVDEIVNYDLTCAPLNKSNYIKKFHKLIELEELERSQILSSYCLVSMLHAVQLIQRSGIIMNAPKGQLFAWLDLPVSLGTDTPAGRLIITGVSTVLLKDKNTDHLVYEALIRDNFEGQEEDRLYISLSERCIKDWKLCDNSAKEVEVQFQIDRLTFCKWHLSLDELCSLDSLYPNKERIKSSVSAGYDVHESVTNLNNKQQERVINNILNSKKADNLPIVVYGPFGTGKTETLALAAKLLTEKTDEDVRILICTHSNSAADLYIDKYFRELAKPQQILRFYQPERRLNTIPDEVKPYCNLSEDKLVIPSAKTITNKRIIVSTFGAAHYFIKMKELKGHFTHIFIDEAAQALECEMLTPLVLATSETRIVLAGDHLQMRQEVFSPEARRQNFNRTIIERLIDYYGGTGKGETYHLLTINYRTAEEILKFISSIFYGGSDNIISGSKWEEKPENFSCLNFFTADGQEMKDSARNSWYNEAEVHELVLRVKALLDDCPWGNCSLKDIGIVATEQAQITRIRAALLRHDLRGVTVHPPMSMQGKEFKAIFISTVRTEKRSLEQTGSLDLGFLTNRNLINTVLTRTKYYIGVVGSPETLCTTGKCAPIWIKYIKHCQENSSIPVPFDMQPAMTIEDYTDDDLEADRILLQLATEAKNDDSNQIRPLDLGNQTNPFMMTNISIEKRHDIAFPVCRPQKPVNKPTTERRVLLSADDYDKEYNSQSSGSESEDETTSRETEYSPDDFNRLILGHPDKYKRCILIIKSSTVIRANVLDKDDPIQEIAISSHRRCGRALNNDEVCVEVIPVDEEEDKIFTDVTPTGEPKMMQGKVIGILKRNISLRYRQFVCTVDELNTGLMIPLNVTMRRMRYVTSSSGKDKQTKDQVPVYRFLKTKEIKFSGYEKITDDNGEKKLFVVRFLKWEKNFMNPLCLITRVLKQGDTMETGLAILDIEHNVRNLFPSKVEENATNIQNQPKEPDDKRLDMTYLDAFTIDPEDSKDLDDALSLEQLQGFCRVGIHISDVSFYVQRNSEIDEEAKSRGTTFYPSGKDPIPMLPESLSADLCSLIPGEDRKTISLFISLNDEAEYITSTICRCTIQSRSRLTYKDAEDIITNDKDIRGNHVSQNVIQSIQRLHKIASMWRKRRLGDAAYFHDLERQSEDTPKAHHLVQEMMIKANELVARTLLDTYPDCCPLRSQMAPSETALEKWKEAYRHIASNTFVLKQPFLRRFHVCSCISDCTCLSQAQDKNMPLVINRPIWQNVMKSFMEKTGFDLSSSLANPDILPEASIALGKLHQIRELSRYICSGDYPANMQYHDTLQTNAYTHFTSPIRRYIDIVVHRLVVAMLQSEPCPYTKRDMSDICSHCTAANRAAKEYETGTHLLAEAVQLRRNPKLIYSVVESMSLTDIQLRFLGLNSIPAAQRRLNVRHLKLGEQPVVERDRMVLTWKDRIYNADRQNTDAPKQTGNKNKKVCTQLNPYRFVGFIGELRWKQLLRAIRSQVLKDIMEACKVVDQETKHKGSNNYASDVDSEQPDNEHADQLCVFSLELSRASVVQVQLSSDVYNGLLTPCIQLLSITPTLAVCIEHHHDPASCFVDVSKSCPVRRQYATMDEYVAGWQYLVAREAVKASVNDGSSVTIHNVGILWIKHDSDWKGSFQLQTSFCCNRSIPLTNSSGDKKDDDEEISLDYICIRFSADELDCDENANSEGCYATEDKPVWVGHGMLTRIDSDNESNTVDVSLKLLQSRQRLPDSVNFWKQKATIELMPRFFPSRREEEALKGMLAAEMPLLEAIALNKRLPAVDRKQNSNLVQSIGKTLRGFPSPNQDQIEAIDEALTNTFTLIQGPPGTGKTITAVRLACLIAEHNKNINYKGKSRPQLMICGPSNDSVDVLTGYLSRLGCFCPAIVRVYGTTIERTEFPLPFEYSVPEKRTCYVIDEKLSKYALHHMIRDSNKCQLAGEIRKYDERIQELKKNGTPMCKEDVKQYEKLLKNAKISVIQNQEIILCTCHASGSKIIKEGCNIRQLIIDENGMCTEPQSMVPIVATSPERITLIGDHKQLQPIVTDERARRLGLGVSLFQRYAKQAHMLVTQYRMHQSIAAFPSHHFYDDRLKCGSECQKSPSNLRNYWPGGNMHPICFLHTVGEEATLTVQTAEGNENSKSNQQEVDIVYRVVLDLVSNRGVCEKNILILSQYRAQCAKIRNRLDNFRDIKVSTVIAAQGREAEIVILSTVRSLPKAEIESNPSQSWIQRRLGFIADEHQINVAITRAKTGLIIIGNKNLLRCHSMWKELLRHYEEKKAVTTSGDFLNRFRAGRRR